jgi:hypothetical protein
MSGRKRRKQEIMPMDQPFSTNFFLQKIFEKEFWTKLLRQKTFQLTGDP